MTTHRRLADLDRNYPMIGATGSAWPGEPRRGYRWFERTEAIGSGEQAWDFASAEVVRWGIKIRSGFRVVDGDGTHSDGLVVTPGGRHWLVAVIGPLRIREPVEIISVTRERDRSGFAYGTLTGHPVSGEESFMVTRDAGGIVRLTIRSVSGSSSGRWRMAAPMVALAQRIYRRRYFRALATRGIRQGRARTRGCGARRTSAPDPSRGR